MSPKETEPDDVELAAFKALERIAIAVEGIRQILENSLDQDGNIGVQIVGAIYTEAP